MAAEKMHDNITPTEVEPTSQHLDHVAGMPVKYDTDDGKVAVDADGFEGDLDPMPKGYFLSPFRIWVLGGQLWFRLYCPCPQHHQR